MPRRRDEIRPIKVEKNCWLYSEKQGMSVVIERTFEDAKVRSVICMIPWAIVERATAEKPKG